MSTRSVIVRLEAEVAGYVAGMGKAGQATDNVARQVAQARKSMDQNAQAMDTAGKTLLGFGTVSVAALGASAKAAMDWESAWAGVTKTVDGTPEQMNELEESLRGLAKTLPATHEEIAGVAEAAGQLGVKRADIAAFTKTMVDLGETTNLTAEEAATDIAQIANVMGTAGDEIDNFGAALVALGNDGASTEKDILSMAQRIAGAGATVGATEQEVLALSNTLASMGVKAELGGGVTTRVLLKMYAGVKEGGEKLEAFAKIAGTSGQEFAKAFEGSPVQAMNLVAQGLGRIKDEGGNVVSALKDVGIKGTEELQVMLALAASGDLLTRSLDLGNKAWKENTALLNEANKRYETTESKVKVAWNNIKDAAIDAGAVMLPVIRKVAESVSGLAQGFGSLPAPLQSAVTMFGGIVGVAALAGGGLLTLLPKLNDTRVAFRDLNASGSRIPGMLGKVAKGAGLAAGALIAFDAVKSLHNGLQKETDSLETFSNALVSVGQNSGALDGLFDKIGAAEFEGEINNAGDALNRLINQNVMSGLESFGSTVLGIDNGMTKLADGITKTDQALNSAVTSGKLDIAAKGFKTIADSADAQGISLEKVGERFPQYLDSLRGLATEAGVTLSNQDLLNWALGETPAAMQGAADGTKGLDGALQDTGDTLTDVTADMDKFLEQLFAAGLITMSARDANAAYNDALRGMPETLKEIAKAGGKMGRTLNDNATDFDLTTEAGAKANGAFQDIAQKGFAEVEAMSKEGLGQEELQTKLNTTYEDMLTAANGAGIMGDKAVALTRKLLGVPDNVDIKTWMDDQAKRMAEATQGAINRIDRRVDINVNTFATTFEKRVGLPSQMADGSYGQGLGVLAPGGNKASGGDLDSAPGPKGVDSQYFKGAKGEHVLTAQEVDAMGGQQAVYRFRAQVRASDIKGYANGGGLGAVGAVTASQSIRAAGGGTTIHVDLSGATYTALDPVELRREIRDDITHELNRKSGVRFV